MKYDVGLVALAVKNVFSNRPARRRQ